MATETKSWFIGERSEALASLLLRSRSDIQIRDESSADGGADFLVDVRQGDTPWRMLFVVEVKGTTSPDPKAWSEDAKQVFDDHQASPPTLPTCLFLFNVRDHKAHYAWVAEPLVEPGTPATLQLVGLGDFRELDQPAMDDVIRRVREWYAATPRQPAQKGARPSAP